MASQLNDLLKGVVCQILVAMRNVSFLSNQLNFMVTRQPSELVQTHHCYNSRMTGVSLDSMGDLHDLRNS